MSVSSSLSVRETAMKLPTTLIALSLLLRFVNAHIDSCVSLVGHRKNLKQCQHGMANLPSTAKGPFSASDRQMRVVALRGGGGTEGTVATVSLKAMLQVGLTLGHFACWFVPLHLKAFTENKWVMSIANSFSGGVFVALAFGHLMPEAIHGFVEAKDGGGSAIVPCVVTCLGYFLIFVVEKVLFNTDALLQDSHNDHGHADTCPSPDTPVSAYGTVEGGPRGVGSAILLLIALGVHSVIETMALGVQSTSKSAWLLAASIGLHQPAESLALLVALVKSGLPKSRIILLLGAFTALGPLGLAAGIAAKRIIGARTESLLVALTAGTFIYVGATEVVAEEFESPIENKWPKVGALSMGVVLIAAIIYATEAIETGVGVGI